MQTSHGSSRPTTPTKKVVFITAAEKERMAILSNKPTSPASNSSTSGEAATETATTKATAATKAENKTATEETEVESSNGRFKAAAATSTPDHAERMDAESPTSTKRPSHPEISSASVIVVAKPTHSGEGGQRLRSVEKENEVGNEEEERKPLGQQKSQSSPSSLLVEVRQERRRKVAISETPIFVPNT
jgi:hypothetical protein